jgi:hypothetical protein
MLQMLLEATQINTPIRECQKVVLSFLLTADSEKLEYLMEFDGVLAVHVLYVTHGQKRKP